MSRPPFRGPFTPLLMALLTWIPLQVGAQSATLRVEENVRAAPNGTIVGQLNPGSRVQVVGSEGNWSRVTLEGVVWLASLQARDEGAFDLVVTSTDGENLRDEPQGRIAGRLVQGALLEEVSRTPGWARVRRTAWIWTPSLEIGAVPPPQRVPPGGGVAPAPATETPPPAAPARSPEWVRASRGGTPILSAPDGDTLSTARGGSELRVMAREGNWARVQVEGWVWIPGLTEGGEDAETPVVRGVHPAEVARERERFRGRVMEFTLQFISLERAEQVRTDFYEGEPFLLTRSVDGERVFVYVAIPPERLEEARRLTPLERIRVTGRVRAGAASLTGSPILDLMEVERVR